MAIAIVTAVVLALIGLACLVWGIRRMSKPQPESSTQSEQSGLGGGAFGVNVTLNGPWPLAVSGFGVVMLVAAAGLIVVRADSSLGASSTKSPHVSASNLGSRATGRPSASPTASSPTGPPEIMISYPRNDAHLPNNTFGATGIARDIPAGTYLWLVLKPSNYRRWYPVSAITVVNSTWAIGANTICPAGGLQNLEVFLVPKIAQSQLLAYVSHRTSQHDPGIGNMPTLASRGAVSHVHVKYDAKKFC